MSIITGLLVLIFNDGSYKIAHADNVTTQTVNYVIGNVHEIEITGGARTLTVVPPAAGDPIANVTDAVSTYAITSNGANQVITGEIDTDMPAETSLGITLAPPTGGNSLGQIVLNTTAQILVDGIIPVVDATSSITYELAANVNATLVSAGKTVTLTVTPE